MLILGNFGKGGLQAGLPSRLVARGWRRLAQVDYYDIYVRQTKSPGSTRKTGPHRPIKSTAAIPSLSLTAH